MHTESKRLPTAAKLAWCCSKDNLVLAVKSMYTTKRLHPGQCPVLFQILFYDAAHSLTRCRGGPLRRFMPTAARAPLPTATPPSIPASPAPAPHLGGDASSTFSSEPRPLRNISNFCYVNSVISALIPTGILNDHGPASRALHREASCHAAMGPHVLTASFSLRHVTPTWRYDGSQQDASEYLTALFRGLSSFPISRPWETKDPETGSNLLWIEEVLFFCSRLQSGRTRRVFRTC